MNANAPRFNSLALPEEEREMAGHLGMLLIVLGSYAVRFYEAVTLFDYCRHNMRGAIASLRDRTDFLDPATVDHLQRVKGRHAGWASIAARDAAMSVYHFGSALDGILKAVRKCPTLLSLCDLVTLNTAQPLFRKSFPRAEGLRHAVGHSADFLRTPEVMAAHASYEDGGGGRTIHENLVNRTLVTTFEGKVLELELSESSLARLRESLEAAYSGFRPASEALELKFLEMIQKSRPSS